MIAVRVRRCPSDAGRVERRIADTGPGMPADQVAVSHRFIANAGGTIRSDSEPGRGTTVIMTLPVAGGRRP